MRAFADRRDAGRRLAEALSRAALSDVVVLALPRGGVPVAFEVATSLDAPLDVVVARKVGAPFNPEFGIGAIAEGDVRVVDVVALRALGMSAAEFDVLAARERAELHRRVVMYRGDRDMTPVQGRVAVVVDDGLATGVTAEAGAVAVRRLDPSRLVLAAPTCAPETAARLETVVDDVVCVERPRNFRAVGEWYERFDQTSDDEVVELLDRSRRQTAAKSGGAGSSPPRPGTGSSG